MSFVLPSFHFLNVLTAFFKLRNVSSLRAYRERDNIDADGRRY